MESLAKLRWRCRRGTRELDWLLQNYLDNFFCHAQKDEQLAFIDLLKQEDNVLQALLLGNGLSENAVFNRVVRQIRIQNARPSITSSFAEANGAPD